MRQIESPAAQHLLNPFLSLFFEIKNCSMNMGSAQPCYLFISEAVLTLIGVLAILEGEKCLVMDLARVGSLGRG
jgi:hypothetical protein